MVKIVAEVDTIVFFFIRTTRLTVQTRPDELVSLR